MLIYLNGANSTKDHPNENLARELLELHTVGVGAFDEGDVKDARPHPHRVPDRRPQDLGLLLRPRLPRHRAGAGPRLRPPQQGRRRTRRHRRAPALPGPPPRTARRIARRLAVVFVSDTPPPALVKRLAEVYLANRTAIKPVLRALVASPEFAAAADGKVRDPSQDVVATFGLLGTTLSPPGIDDTSAASLIVHIADTVGLAPMTWPLPDGSPLLNAPWSSPARVMASFDLHWKMAGRLQPNHNITYRAPADWLPAASITLRDLVDHLSRTLHHRPSTAALLQACCESVELPPGEVITPTHPLVTNRMARLLVVFLDHPIHFSR